VTTPAPAPLRVAHIGFLSDPAGRPPAQLLAAWPTLVDVAEAAAAAGARVSVIQACAEQAQLRRSGVDYHFLPFDAQRLEDRARLATLLRELRTQLLHVHGLDFCREVRALAALLPQLPLILQDHASRVPRLWRRPLWRRAFSAADALAFCAAEQAQPFVTAGVLPLRTALYAIPESTSRFTPGDQQQARRLTGLHGDPAVLWVGHLDANKDPLTALAGVSEAARQLPDLRLWCCFGAAPLLPQVEERIRHDARLRERVRLIGRVPHAQIEQFMRAADVFILASHHEGSGYALIEALACGLPPVVTDIPSFRALTGAGAVGALWPCGDAPRLSAALQALAAGGSAAARAAVRAHFDREIALPALGAKLVAMYAAVLERRRWAQAATQRGRRAH
jgi:glycosyltransferase involved in cell wall biosynthesis